MRENVRASGDAAAPRRNRSPKKKAVSVSAAAGPPTRTAVGDALFDRAESAWKAGNHRQALRLFVQAVAKCSRGAVLNVGYFHDEGLGVKPDKEEALKWYRRAHRQGDDSGTHNIGLIWRERGDTRRAIQWLERAVAAGNDDSRLQLAAIYLSCGRKAEAKRHLMRLQRSSTATVASRRQARAKLRALESKTVRAKHGRTSPR